MAFTTQVRAPQADDMAFALRCAGLVGVQWNEDTVRNYVAHPNFVGRVGLARWPEQGVANFTRAGMIMGLGRAPVVWIGLMALDPLVVAETNTTQRRILADRLLRQSLESAVAAGYTTGRAKRIPHGTPMSAYIQGIAVAVAEDTGEGSDNWQGDLASVIAFLLARSG